MISSSGHETLLFGKTFAQQLKKGDILALHGDLGAGKTTFIKGVVEELTKINGKEVQSPTFTYLTVYEAPTPLFHFDLYRLDTYKGFIERGFLDYFEEEGICLIEWAEKIAPLLPPHTIQIHFTHLEGDKRRLDVYKP